MENYLTVEDVAKKWSISVRRVQILCNGKRIQGAEKIGGIWFIPADAEKPNRRKSNSKKKNAIQHKRVVSLFSGCGGMDLGFEGDFSVLKRAVNTDVNPDWELQEIDENWVRLGKTSFNTVFANDIKPDAKVAWSNFFKNKGLDESTYYLDSIVDLVKLHKENKINIFPNDIDIVTGGFPCQDFSIAGKRKGFESEKGHDGKKLDVDAPSIESRGQLYMWMREVISIVQPKAFVAENVKGLTNLDNVKEIIEHDFSTICNGGYLVIPAQVLHAADYGVAQSRERVIFFGFKKSALTERALQELSKKSIIDEYNPYPLPTHNYNCAENQTLKQYVTVREALIGLEEPNRSKDLAQQKYSKAKFMGRHCQGQIEVDLDGIAPTIRSEHHGNIEFRRLSEEHGGRYIDELNAGKIERRLTIRECARIQTFPDDYQFIINKSGDRKGVSATDAYKIIGNAVPPLLAYHIAKRLESNWELYFGGRENDYNE